MKKRAVRIFISDLDDLDKVLASLEKLMRTIMNHYIDTDINKLKGFCTSFYNYFYYLVFGIKGNEK